MALWNGDGAVSLKVNGENLGSLAPDEVKTAGFGRFKKIFLKNIFKRHRMKFLV